jgi:hypothetical protein
MICATCGGKTRKESSCSYCRRYGAADPDMPPGRWVLVRGVKRWVPNTPTVVEPDEPPPRPPAAVPPTHTLLHEFCPDCAALLLPDEWCPCSRSWARRAEIAHSWAPTFSTDQRLDVAA